MVDSIRSNTHHRTSHEFVNTPVECNETTGNLSSTTTTLNNSTTNTPITTTTTNTFLKTSINNNTTSLKSPKNPLSHHLPSPTTSREIIQKQYNEQNTNNDQQIQQYSGGRRGFFTRKMQRIKRGSLLTTLNTMCSRVRQLWTPVQNS